MGFNGDLMDVMEEIAMVNVGKTMPYGWDLMGNFGDLIGIQWEFCGYQWCG